ncbi:MAG: hypothetical protein JSS99_06990 [Actinobacteria bacterium]|nr:hypothetical protein [Actinomycetota bacterium]
MRARSLLAWIAVGLLGLALAAGVTYAATQLSSQRIGLSAEPPSAGEELAPAAHRHARTRTTTTTPSQPARTTRDERPTGSTEEHGEAARHGSGDLDD